MISESKLLFHLDRMNGDRRPITADIFLTTFCNNHCGFCTYGRWQKHESKFMDSKLFARVVKRLKEIGVKGIILTGGGEPCINPDFDEIVNALDNEQMDYGINSNFLMYRDCDPVFLKVSLDAWDEESYKRIRGVNGYHTVRENIIRFRERHKKTSLGIQQIGLNVDDVKRFYWRNYDLPVDYIVIRPIESTGGKYYMENPSGADDVISCVNELSKSDSRVKLNFKFHLIGQRFSECVAHWSQIAVNEDANVVYCCHKPYEVIGNLFDNDIMEKHKKAVTDMKMCDIPCRLTAPNLCVVPRDVNFI